MWLTALGLGAVTRAGWIALGVTAAALLAVIGTQHWQLRALRAELRETAHRLGQTQTAKAACDAVVERQRIAAQALRDAAERASEAMQRYRDALERQTQLAQAAAAAAEARAAASERVAAHLRRRMGERDIRAGESECAAAVRIIREELR